MSRRNGNFINGWIVVDKPVSVTSTQVVSLLRRRLNARKCGHAGTLDPLASGVLPIAFGEATKIIPLVMEGEKTYEFSVRWGEERSTDDAEGSVTGLSSYRPKESDILAITSKFTGEIEQTPPKFSAIKINGQRAYTLARAGVNLELQPRTVVIHKLDLIEVSCSQSASFRVLCGKGTYIRSLGRDIARRLGTLGYVSKLHRTQTGPFDITHTISLDNFDSLVHIAPALDCLLPIEAALDDIPALFLSSSQAERVRHGGSVPLSEVKHSKPLEMDRNGGARGLVCAMTNGRLLALTRIRNGLVCPTRVLNHTN